MATPTVTPNLGLLEQVECVVITPLSNQTKNPNAAVIIEDLLVQELLSSKKFRFMEAAAVRLKLAEINFSETQLRPEKLGELTKHFNAEAILLGSVENYGFIPDPTSDELKPSLTLSLSLYHLPSTHLIWTRKLTEEGAGVSQRQPLTSVAIQAVTKLLADWNRAVAKRKPPNHDNSQLCGTWLSSDK